ncbi:MAG: class I SAM-dependent methyltransferase [Planctomycetota bacterium]|jgi:SAM-dependent methyltransferase|nr:class I SAM-dependent methyltransferase [Planctomycetota bacterium]MDA1026100.1 class I SAM-dependent methyltransferase [Planctomycetota bacterium]
MNPTRQHWNDVWSKKAHAEVSWYQADPRSSLSSIDRFGMTDADDVIDVGCGASHLADRLVERKVRRLFLLDVSSVALDAVRSRLVAIDSETAVEYLATDVLDLAPAPSVSLWHDRAVLHFIRDSDARSRYAAIAAAAVRPGGHLVIGGFAPDGPLRCSDLDVERADEADLSRLFEGCFDLESSRRESHETPWGAAQSFQWCVFKRCQIDS